jgi:hypothetical protein
MSTEVSDLLSAEESQERDSAPLVATPVATTRATHGASVPPPPPAIELDFTTAGDDAEQDNGDDL